ncbi:MAG TPA: hypothetical protein VI007_13405 [bacterium]
MPIETEDRMVRVERTCERIAERLGVIEHRLTAIEPRFASGIVSLGYELKSMLDSLRAECRAGDGRLQKQGTVHFYWLIAGVIGTVTVLLLLELVP